MAHRDNKKLNGLTTAPTMDVSDRDAPCRSHAALTAVRKPQLMYTIGRTRQQFVQGLSRLGVEPSPAELELLFKKYDDDGEGSVNYVSFCNHVDVTETFSDRSYSKPQVPLYGGFRNAKVDEAVLKAL